MPAPAVEGELGRDAQSLRRPRDNEKAACRGRQRQAWVRRWGETSTPKAIRSSMYWIIVLTFTFMFFVSNNIEQQWRGEIWQRFTKMMIQHVYRINIESWERVYQGERKGKENSVYTKDEGEQGNLSS